jgi:hypothetical protein
MNNLKDYVVVMNNIMPPPVADMVLDEYKNCDDWINATTNSGEALDVRNCKTIGMSFDNIIQKNETIRRKIDTTLYSVSSQALKEYTRNIPALPNGGFLASKDTGYELLKEVARQKTAFPT